MLCLIVIVLLVSVIGTNAQRGCCSHHEGVSGSCRNGKQVCNDGTTRIQWLAIIFIKKDMRWIMSKYCSSCGKELNENSKFCPGCGQSQSQNINSLNNQVQKSNQSKQTKKKLS